MSESAGGGVVDSPMLSRRQVLLALGGLGLVGFGVSACRSDPATADWTVERWVAERGTGYLVAHRGVGDVVPEHTLQSYEAALGWGAMALEISVAQTSDHVLVCHHDLTLDRTTRLNGPLDRMPWAELERVRVEIPRLGPRWQGAGAPHIPRLDAVLDRVGHRAVLCIEAKDDSTYPAMMQLIQDKGLSDSVIPKLHHSSGRIAEAKQAGYPVFGYVGSFADATLSNIDALGRALDPERDYLVIPSSEGGVLVHDAVIEAAVATGVPVWVFAVHRRSELAHHLTRGVVGAVTSSIGYVSGSIPPATTDDWKGRAILSGEITRQPDVNGYRLAWPGEGRLWLVVQGQQAFVLLGQLAPVGGSTRTFTLDLDVRVDTAPASDQTNISIAFGHDDDSYYEHRLGVHNGYHALLRLNGSLELWAHRAGSSDGESLAPAQAGPSVRPGSWVGLRLEVTPATITLTRTDTGATLTARDARFTGGYLHVGRSAIDGTVSLRTLRVSGG